MSDIRMPTTYDDCEELEEVDQDDIDMDDFDAYNEVDDEQEDCTNDYDDVDFGELDHPIVSFMAQQPPRQHTQYRFPRSVVQIESSESYIPNIRVILFYFDNCVIILKYKNYMCISS
jgi:hypothetical protein